MEKNQSKRNRKKRKQGGRGWVEFKTMKIFWYIFGRKQNIRNVRKGKRKRAKVGWTLKNAVEYLS